MAIIRKVRGFTPKIGESTFLADNAVVVGDVTIGEECSIWYGAVLRGDVNRDKVVNISDVTELIDMLLNGSETNDEADCNLDTRVDISDVTALIDFLLSGIWAN